ARDSCSRSQQEVALLRPHGEAEERHEPQELALQLLRAGRLEGRAARALRRGIAPLDRELVVARRVVLEELLELLGLQRAAAPLALPVVQAQAEARERVELREPGLDPLALHAVDEVLAVVPAVGMDAQRDLERLALERDAQVGVAVGRVEVLAELGAEHALERALLLLR